MQVLGDGEGNAIHLFDRDCSLQTSSPKSAEEAPAPEIPDDIKEPILQACVRPVSKLTIAVQGRLNFIWRRAIFLYWDEYPRTGWAPVTEMITGIDDGGWAA